MLLPELIEIIISYLNIHDLLAFSYVNKLFCSYSENSIKQSQIKYIENSLRSGTFSLERRKLLLKKVIPEWIQGNHSILNTYSLERFQNIIYYIKKISEKYQIVPEDEAEYVFLYVSHTYYESGTIPKDEYFLFNTKKFIWKELTQYNFESSHSDYISEFISIRLNLLKQGRLYGSLDYDGDLSIHKIDPYKYSIDIDSNSSVNDIYDIMIELGIGFSDENDQIENFYESWQKKQIIRMIIDELADTNRLIPYWT